MAGHFALLGHRVTLYNRNVISSVFNTKRITLSGAIKGTGNLFMVTDDLSLAVEDANLIMLTTTADAHRELAKNMAPYIQDGQIIILNPGRTFGAFEFANTLRDMSNKSVLIAEAQSLIYACRVVNPGNAKVIGIKEKVLLAAYPAKDTDYVLNYINSVYNCFIKAESILYTSLENIGAIFHPAVVLFNAAAIERGNSFYFYNDMTPLIANFLLKLDNERINVGKALNIDLMGIEDWVSFAYPGIEGRNLCEKMRNNPAYYKLLAPKKIDSRLITEDVPTGLVPISQIGDWLGVDTSIMKSIIHLTSHLTGNDFLKTGRTIKNLGLESISLNEFLKTL